MTERRGLIIHPEELDASWPDRLCDAHINTLGLHPVGGINAAQTLESAIQRHSLPYFRELLKKLDRLGIRVEYEAHAMGWLLPRGLFDIMPDWFRMDESGARVNDFNLCPSNTEALDYVAERASLLARLTETGSDRYFFWLDDVADKRCFCPKCRSLSAGDQQMLTVNSMLRGIRTYNRQAKLCYLAYVDTITGPDTVSPADSVFLEYAPIRRDSHRPLFDADSAENAAEVRHINHLIDVFGRKGSQVLEYWIDNSRFSGWKKPPKQLLLDSDVMKADVAAYRALGFENITSFGCYLGADYSALWGEPPVQEYGDILFDRKMA